MGERWKRHSAPMEDFKPFYKKDGLIWVPYLSDGDWRLHFLTPEIVVKGVCYALPMLADSKVIPFAARAVRDQIKSRLEAWAPVH